MNLKDSARWFKNSFGLKIHTNIAGTPLTVDFMCSVALQETGYIWRTLVAKGYSQSEVLRLCVGDTIDTPKRKAFPKNKEALLSVSHGQEMFDIAHESLVEMAKATGIQSYLNAANNPDKFCHGYGIFQRDLQFFKDDPDYFLEQKWADFDCCIEEAILLFKHILKQLNYENREKLSDPELCNVAIVYNIGFGNFDPHKGLKQGYVSDGIFYGENIAKFLAIAHSIDDDHPDGSPVEIPQSTLPLYKVIAKPSLNLRAGPDTTFDIKSSLSFGSQLSVAKIIDGAHGKWALVDLDGDGGMDGFVFADFISPV